MRKVVLVVAALAALLAVVVAQSGVITPSHGVVLASSHSPPGQAATFSGDQIQYLVDMIDNTNNDGNVPAATAPSTGVITGANANSCLMINDANLALVHLGEPNISDAGQFYCVAPHVGANSQLASLVGPRFGHHHVGKTAEFVGHYTMNFATATTLAGIAPRAMRYCDLQGTFAGVYSPGCTRPAMVADHFMGFDPVWASGALSRT